MEVVSKGGKSETILLHYKACQALAAYLKARSPADHDFLLVTKFSTTDIDLWENDPDERAVKRWTAELDRLLARIGPRFARSEACERAAAYVKAC